MKTRFPDINGGVCASPIYVKHGSITQIINSIHWCAFLNMHTGLISIRTYDHYHNAYAATGMDGEVKVTQGTGVKSVCPFTRPKQADLIEIANRYVTGDCDYMDFDAWFELFQAERNYYAV